MQTFMLTYNPDSHHWPKERSNRLRDEIAKAPQGEPVRWNCPQSTVKGDRGLLLRQGDVQGIFGLAKATCDAFPDPDGKKGRYYANWHLDHIADPEQGGPIIPIQELERRFPNVHWHPRQSGTSVPESVMDELTREILAGKK